jgi:hypothetical protein
MIGLFMDVKCVKLLFIQLNRYFNNPLDGADLKFLQLLNGLGITVF